MHDYLTRVLKMHLVPDNRFRLAWRSCTSRIPTILPGHISALAATNLAKWKRNGSRNYGLRNMRGTACFAKVPVRLEPRAHKRVCVVRMAFQSKFTRELVGYLLRMNNIGADRHPTAH